MEATQKKPQTEAERIAAEVRASQAELHAIGTRVAADIDARRAEREAPLSEDENAQRAEFLAEAQRAHEKHVAERPERYEARFNEMCALLSEICDRLAPR